MSIVYNVKEDQTEVADNEKLIEENVVVTFNLQGLINRREMISGHIKQLIIELNNANLQMDEIDAKIAEVKLSTGLLAEVETPVIVKG